MGFPSPATDYVEKRLDLNEIFLPHPTNTIRIERGGRSAFVDTVIKPSQGDTVAFELFGDCFAGKLLSDGIVTDEVDRIGGDQLREVIVIGVIVCEVITLGDDKRPTI